MSRYCEEAHQTPDKGTFPDHLGTLTAVADEIFERWDKDMRSGKLLTALAGRLSGYRADIDALRAALSLRLREALQPLAEIPSSTPTNRGVTLEDADDDALACGLNIRVGDIRRAQRTLAVSP